MPPGAHRPRSPACRHSAPAEIGPMTIEPGRAHLRDFASVVEVLSETTAFTLATLNDDASPRATPLFFATDDRFCLYFLSEAGSRHAQNLAREPRAGAAIFPMVGD